jgi:hypothetical protein
MTMIFLIASMMCVVVATTAFWGYARYARWDLKRLYALEEQLEQYVDFAKMLAANKKTPTPLLEDILALNRSLDGSRESRRLLNILKAVPVGRLKADGHRIEICDFLARENLADVHRKMAESYILTISYKDRVRGPRIRKLIASPRVQGSPRVLGMSFDAHDYLLFTFLIVAAVAAVAVAVWIKPSIFMWHLLWIIVGGWWILYWFGKRGFIGRFAWLASEKAEELITPEERVIGAVTRLTL